MPFEKSPHLLVNIRRITCRMWVTHHYDNNYSYLGHYSLRSIGRHCYDYWPARQQFAARQIQTRTTTALFEDLF